MRWGFARHLNVRAETSASPPALQQSGLSMVFLEARQKAAIREQGAHTVYRPRGRAAHISPDAEGSGCAYRTRRPGCVRTKGRGELCEPEGGKPPSTSK